LRGPITPETGFVRRAGPSRFTIFANARRRYHNTYIIDRVKALVFMGSSLDDLKDFPAEVRRAAGFQLSFVQQGLTPSDWKTISGVGSGALEIRIHVLGEWRIIYVAKFDEAIYVLHTFQKKTRKTEAKEIELARKRYREIGGKR
jgi:phage-related protein